MKDISKINLLMMDWRRILELKNDDLIRLKLKDNSELTGFIHNSEDGDAPVKLPASHLYDVIIIRQAKEYQGNLDELDLTGSDWKVVYKHEIETLDIIRAGE